MAIRKRISQPKEEEIQKEENSLEIPIKNWVEESKRILDILESTEGINFYDPERKPGMYLKKQKYPNIPKELKSKFKENPTIINNEEPNLNNLFNHLKQK